MKLRLLLASAALLSAQVVHAEQYDRRSESCQLSGTVEDIHTPPVPLLISLNVTNRVVYTAEGDVVFLEKGTWTASDGQPIPPLLAARFDAAVLTASTYPSVRPGHTFEPLM